MNKLNYPSVGLVAFFLFSSISGGGFAHARPTDGAKAFSPKAQLALSELNQYRTEHEHEAYEKALSLYAPQRKAVIDNLVGSLLFVDYGHAATDLTAIFLGQKTLEQATCPYRYDTPTEHALGDYFSARNFLGNSPDFNFATITAVQGHAMAGGISGLAEEDLGRIRHRFVYGPEFDGPDAGLFPDQIKAINESPYLIFQPATGIYADVPQGIDKAQNGKKIKGVTLYPRPRDLKTATLERVRAFAPEVAARVDAYQAKHGKNELDPQSWKNWDEDLTRDLIVALVKERIDTFINERAKLGTLSTPEQLDHYIHLISQFQKDFVSIHPFQDGNGRTSRMLLYYLAEREGLPAPRLTYPNEDEYWMSEPWAGQIEDGMLSTLHLEKDFMERLKSGRPLEASVELLTPCVSRYAGDKEITSDQYGDYVRNQFKNKPDILGQLANDPVGSMRNLQADFESSLAPASLPVPENVHP